jgi:hypothetical protein
MMNRPYPPSEPFHQLSREDQRARLDASWDISFMINWLRGDPRLTWWEEAFLTSMKDRLRLTRGQMAISPKQWDKLWQIMEKVEEDPTEDTAEELAEV